MLIVLALVGPAPSPTSAKEAVASGLVTLDGPPLIVAAPDGWVVDDRPGVEDGIPLVLFPSGGSFQQSPAVIYVRTFARKSERTLAAFVRDDVAQQRARSKHCRVGERPAIALGSGVRAWLRDFTNDRWGNCETVAYLEGEEGYITVVLSARDEKSRAAAADAFGDVLRNLRIVGEDRTLRAVVAAYRAARKNAATRQGTAFETRVTETFGKAQCDAMRDCAGPATGGEREVFDLLLRLGSDGKVEQVLARPETRAADCLRSALASAKLVAPPKPAYWVKVTLSSSKRAELPAVAESN